MRNPRLPLLAIVLFGASAALAGEPDYPHGEFQDDCARCHANDSWTPATIAKEFEHAKRTFPLTGAHAATPCRSCHATLEFKRSDPACVSCHQDVHRGELGRDCGRCHTPRSFIDRAGMGRLHATTRFPLTGAHLATDCEDCHRPVGQGGLQFVGTSLECRTCHLAAYQATTDPDHVAAGFSTDCRECHTSTTWASAGVDHARTDFPLTGAHRAVACGACHAGGYSGTPTECYACHSGDYEGTTDPGHQAAGFPTLCATCHTTTTWSGATMPAHDASYFPIYSGEHRNKWTACSDCHTSPSNFQAFSCIECHEHSDQAHVTDQHDGVSGFVYDGQSCYGCHPRGDS